MSTKFKLLASALAIASVFAAVGAAQASRPRAVAQSFTLARDDARAMRSASKECKAGSASACADLGGAYLSRGAEGDYARGVELLKKSCGAGNGDACIDLHSLGEDR